MGLTVKRDVLHNELTDYISRLSQITFDSSYPTGGEALTAADLGFDDLASDLIVHPVSKGGLVFQYDGDNAKLLAYAGAVDSSDVFAYAPGGGDTKGATVTSSARRTADQAADVVNAGLYINYQTFTTIDGNDEGFGTVTLQPAFARNLTISIKNDSGGPLNLYTGTMTFTVVGTFRGAAQTEAIALTLTGGQVAVANTPKYRSVAGVKPFDTITSVTIDETSSTAIAVADGALKVGVGPGTLIGLPVNTLTGANGDVIEFSVNNAARTVAGNMDFTNETFDVGTTADGDDIAILYKRGQQVGGTDYGTNHSLPEIDAASDISAVGAVTIIAWGRKPSTD